MTTPQTATPVDARTISRELALEALDNMDDYARMAVGIAATGPISVLRAFIDHHAPPAQAAPVGASLNLDFKQATELLAMYGGEPSEITLIQGDGHSGKGIYAHYTEYPEEGAEFLGVADDEATPTQPAAKLDVLRDTLQKIVDANPRDWQELSEPMGEFERWAKSRAMHALAQADAAQPAGVRMLTENEYGELPDHGRGMWQKFEAVQAKFCEVNNLTVKP